MSSRRASGSPSGFNVPTIQDLREMRILTGLTKKQVADRGGWTRQTVARWEKGKHAPKRDQIVKLIDIYESEGAQKNPAGPETGMEAAE